MDTKSLLLAEAYCRKQYVETGVENLSSLHRILRSLLAQRQCPEEGLSDLMVEHLVMQLSLMDSNNFGGHVSGGEREGRVVAPLVRRRHFGFSHGIGRSGNLTEDQPKAAGGSLLYQITNFLLLDLLRMSGASSFKAALCVPLATGMTLALVLRAVAKQREQEIKEKHHIKEEGEDVVFLNNAAPCFSGPRFVIWPRMDQKTALKCIDAAGFTAVPVPLRRAIQLPQFPVKKRVTGCSAKAAPHPHPFFLQVHVDDIVSAIERLGGVDQVVCILSTTSCFAPRLPDDVVAIAKYAQSAGLPYVINNAYGVQSKVIMNQIESAQRRYRVDYVVQSGDKNFLVPVGGSVVASRSEAAVKRVGEVYAGRASSAPIMDLFMTALYLGRRGMREMWEKRELVRAALCCRLSHFAAERKELLIQEFMHPFKMMNNSTEIVLEHGQDEEAMLAHTSKDFTVPEDPAVDEPCDQKENLQRARNDISMAITMYRFGLSPHQSSHCPVHVPSTDERTFSRSDEAGNTLVFPILTAEEEEKRSASCRALGGKLFRSRVTGTRVVFPKPHFRTTVCGKYSFCSYGCHEDTPPCPLLVIACGIGMELEEVESLMRILAKLWPS